MPTGLPVDLRVGLKSIAKSSSPSPWSKDVADTNDDEFNALTDLELYQNKVMKGPKSICRNGSSTKSQRTDLDYFVRRIIVRQYMEAGKTYQLRMKSCLDSYEQAFYLDYLEFCPQSVFDNPDTPEDIW